MHLASRFLVALIFILSGLGKTFSFGATAAMMKNVGFPAPEFFLFAAILIEIVAGFALLTGFKTKYASWALVAFLIPATIIFHVPGITDPVHGQEQMVHTLKNLAIVGALLKFAADGAGLLGLDNLWKKRSSQEIQSSSKIEDATVTV